MNVRRFKPVAAVASVEEADKQLEPARLTLVERLYRDHWKHLCTRLRKVFGNGPPEPEDLAQTAFTKLIEYADAARLDDPASFLFRIAINAGRDRRRHIVRATAIIEQQLAPQGLEQLDRITPSNVYETRECIAVTERAMATLTPKQREVLIRSRLRGETFEQIRDACGWSKADISRTLQAALGVLQTAMREYLGHD
ncbi:RNA polymerase sigma factor [Steroidobacter sp. S1-65]|uniref:RNA polymerase sigma factor n=1 Tax=Steroidobacter gossypii TaxID=2805490 RepID=A0ABS1X0S8_9GAMM|nr:RNA polymerase sigma factor [Steroidobacter gossypii]MBM0106821.1 RNA polymerase sigma factor [Steroidobacter gossypii]